MAFKRSAVRSRLSPPLQKEIDWSTFARKYFIESLAKETHHVPWKLNIVIMMQLWEGNSKGNFFSVSISKLRWVKIQFLAKKLLETWACIIQLYREPIGLSIRLTEKETVSKPFPLQIKSPAQAGFDLRGGTAQRSAVFDDSRKRNEADADSDEVKL